MPSPKDDSYLLNIWKKLEKDYILSGLSRWGALARIAGEYSVSPYTVYKWLTPRHKAHELKYDLSKIRKKQKREWARKPENRTILSEYSKNYQKTRRHLSSYIQELFLEENAMSLQSISAKIEEKTNIRFNKKIILGAIAKYNYENEENPILEIDPDFYGIKYKIS